MVGRSRPLVWVALVSVVVLGAVLLAGCGSSGGAASGGSQPTATSQKQTYTDSGFGFAYGLYGLAVPGAAYVTPNPGTDTATLTTSSGVKTASTLQLNADGTYVWNSAWDGKVIKGKWEKTGNGDYPIVVRAGQEGKDWKLGKGDHSEIILWDGSFMTYNGDRPK